MRHENSTNIFHAQLAEMAQTGRERDINFLMGILGTSASFLHCKLVDNALGQVESTEGRNRIRHFLFNGSQIQRNYAALYFKRRGSVALLEEAVQQGCIDKIQAFSR